MAHKKKEKKEKEILCSKVGNCKFCGLKGFSCSLYDLHGGLKIELLLFYNSKCLEVLHKKLGPGSGIRIHQKSWIRIP
jgi:hypothetical protein